MGKPLYAKDLHCSQNALVCNFQDSSRKGAENCFQGCGPDKIIFKVFVRALPEWGPGITHAQTHTHVHACTRMHVHTHSHTYAGGSSMTTITNRLGVWILWSTSVSYIWIFTGWALGIWETDNCSHQYRGEEVLQGRKGQFNRLIHWPFTFWF